MGYSVICSLCALHNWMTLVVVATVDMDNKMIISGPDIVSRGFVYVKESEELMKEARSIAENSLLRVMSKRINDRVFLKNIIKDDLAKFINKETKRKPMILPIIMDV